MVSKALLASLVLVALLGGCKRQNAYVPPPPPKVGVAQPVKQRVTPYLEETGNTVAYNQVDLVARVEGFLQDIKYTDGAEAKRGDTLFVIEPAPYQAKLQQAQASLASTQALLVQAEAEYRRQSSLGRSDFASQSAVDQARAKQDSTKADLQNQQAGVTLAATNLGYTQVTAPFDGMVTAHLVSVGALVGVSGHTKLATIVQLAPIYVTFNISEQDVLRIRASLKRHGVKAADLHKVPVEVGLMTEEGFPHQGTLDYASPDVDTSTGTLMVRGILANADHALLPGYFVRIRVPLELQTKEALLVPDDVVGINQAGHYVLVVGKDDTVEQRKVQLGQLVGQLRAIDSGLKADDRVIISGLSRAVAGTKVAPQPGEIRTASAAAPGSAQ
jgi:RND family efflux transporter MFP subunit